jgi:hypothetical protein
MIGPSLQVQSRLNINVMSVMDGKNICKNQQQYPPHKNVQNKSLTAKRAVFKKNINLFKVADNCETSINN